MWPKGTGPTLSGNAAGALTTADASNTADASDVDVLRSGQWVSLGHWLLDSSGTSCVPGNGRYLASGSWTHPKCLAFRVMGLTWPVALRLIRNVLRSGAGFVLRSVSSSLIFLGSVGRHPISAGITVSTPVSLSCFLFKSSGIRHQTFEWDHLIELGSVIRDYHSWKPETTHDVIPHELLYVLPCDSGQRLCFDPFRKVVDGYITEFRFFQRPCGVGARLSNTPLVNGHGAHGLKVIRVLGCLGIGSCTWHESHFWVTLLASLCMVGQ
ncbi:hypothetical protein Tco_0105697 [Tanacetum coccineum]